MVTDEKASKQAEQPETGDLKARIEKLRAEGKTYRQIAEMERVSIAQISRILKKPAVMEPSIKPESPTPETDGEQASRLFDKFEKGVSLPQVVIGLKMPPDIVRQFYDQWVELKEIDVNQPIVLKKIKELEEWLMEEFVSNFLLRQLLGHAKDIGGFRLRNCSYVDSEGFCRNWYWKKEDGSEYHKQADALRCAFCFDFNKKDIFLERVLKG